MPQNNNDFGEIFCQAVQTIVSGNMSNLTYDISRECTVIKVIDKAYGKYKVSDGSISFEAVATEGATYEVDNRVIVTIPQGDTNKQITILSKVLDEWSTPGGYVRPRDTLTALTSNIVFGTDGSEEFSLRANSDVAIKDPSVLNLTNQHYLGFNRIGVIAKFKTLLTGAVSGDYGLIFTLIKTKTGTDQINQVHQQKFSCKDMLGNPYSFYDYFEQEYAFPIPEGFDQINELKVDFYQSGDFAGGSGNISHDYDDIYMKDLEIYLGYAKDVEAKETVQIVSDNLEYPGSSSQETRDVYLQWIHQTDQNKLMEITLSEYKSSSNYEVRWYQKESGCPTEDTDEYGGKGWKLLNKTIPEAPYDNYPFRLSVEMRPEYDEEKIKAICLLKTRPLVNDQSYVQILSWSSNTLTFKNTNEASGGSEPSTTTIKKNLHLHFNDNSYGNYFLYDQNGILHDSANQGQSKIREVSIFYGDQSLHEYTTWFDRVSSITWEVPALTQDNSMIIYDKTQNGGVQEPNNELLSSDETKWKHLHIEKQTTALVTEGSTGFSKDIDVNDKGNDFKYKDSYIYQDIINKTNGKYQFSVKVTALKLKAGTGKQVNIKLSAWISNDQTSWTLISDILKTINIGSEAEIDSVFTINQEHQYIRVGVGINYSQEGFNIEDLADDGKTMKIDTPSLKLQSQFYTNTNYPTTDSAGNRQLSTSFKYAIADSWSRSRTNNTIRCKVAIGDKIYELSEELRFGTKGSNGTNNTFLLEMMDGKNALVIDSADKELQIRALLIHNNGSMYYFGDEDEITWTLIHGNDDYMELVEPIKDTPSYIRKIKLKNVSDVPSDNYAILKAAYTYKNGPTLEAFLPIPIKHSSCSSISGTTEVIYNHQGQPRYGLEPYTAHIGNSDFVDRDLKKQTGWLITTDTGNPNNFELKNKDDTKQAEGVILAPSPLFIKKEDGGPIYDSVCVYYKKDNKILWSQPILVMQSHYDFAMLNSWDGTLAIDKQKGTILATMLGAGKKNDKNEFSGVLIGDVQGGTGLQDTSAMTGVYGFQEGVMSYGLMENGSAFFGASANGRIEIDGNHGVIKSYGWEKTESGKKRPNGIPLYNWSLPQNQSGTLIDLDDGMLLMQTTNGSYFKFNENHDQGLSIGINGESLTLLTDEGNNNIVSYIALQDNKVKLEVAKKATYSCTCATGADKNMKVIKGITSPTNTKLDALDIGCIINVTFSQLHNNATDTLTFQMENVIDSDSGEVVQYDVKGNPTWKKNETLPFVLVEDSGKKKWQLTSLSEAYIDIRENAITSEVRRTAGYACEGKLRGGTTNTWNIEIKATDTEGKLLINDDIKKVGAVIAVTFNQANKATNTVKLKLAGETSQSVYLSGEVTGETNLLQWDQGATLYFSYDNVNVRWNVVDSGAYSKIIQTADNLVAKVYSVTEKEGFGWELTKNGFYLNAYVPKLDDDGNETYEEDENGNEILVTEPATIFTCNKSGIIIGGQGYIQSSNYATKNGFLSKGSRISLLDGTIEAQCLSFTDGEGSLLVLDSANMSIKLPFNIPSDEDLVKNPDLGYLKEQNLNWVQINKTDGIILQTYDFRNVTTVDENQTVTHYGCCQMSPTRDTEQVLNIRSGPGKSYRVIGSHRFGENKNERYFFKTKGNKASADPTTQLDTSNLWIPIFLTSKNKPIMGTLTQKNPPAVGYIYAKGTKTAYLFAAKGCESKVTDACNPKAYNVTSSQTGKSASMFGGRLCLKDRYTNYLMLANNKRALILNGDNDCAIRLFDQDGNVIAGLKWDGTFFSTKSQTIAANKN